jgi:hypothetical protein
VTLNVRNAYDSIFGTQQHAEMNVSFDFSTVEAELDRAEEIEQRGGHDAAELKELIAEVRALHEGGKSVGRGSFARHLEAIQRKGWIWGHIAGTLLSLATGA